MKLWALRITYESKICSDSILHMPGSLTIKHHYLTTHTTESCIILCINLNQKHERCGIVLLLENILNLLRGCWCGCSSVSVSCTIVIRCLSDHQPRPNSGLSFFSQRIPAIHPNKGTVQVNPLYLTLFMSQCNYGTVSVYSKQRVLSCGYTLGAKKFH